MSVVQSGLGLTQAAQMKCIVAQCPDCNGITGIETEFGNQESIDCWFDRGDILSKQTLGWAKKRPLCRCGKAA